MIQFERLGISDLTDPASGAELRAVLVQPKRLALLVYLALANSHRFRRRDTLTGLFWPNVDGDHARGAPGGRDCKFPARRARIGGAGHPWGRRSRRKS